MMRKRKIKAILTAIGYGFLTVLAYSILGRILGGASIIFGLIIGFSVVYGYHKHRSYLSKGEKTLLFVITFLVSFVGLVVLGMLNLAQVLDASIFEVFTFYFKNVFTDLGVTFQIVKANSLMIGLALIGCLIQLRNE